jgi:hypothetical protein
MYRTTLAFSAAALGILLGVGACHNDELISPAIPRYAGGEMFQRYVSFGNSITAGIQSGGLSDSLQRLAYPVLLARAMGGTRFRYPSLNNPGCPTPITVIFTNPPTRLGNLPEAFCALRGAAQPYLSNVAFPGADVLETLNSDYHTPQPPASATDAYKLFLLGGRTELQRAREVQPTFVTVWLGNNDVLGAILDTGDAGQAADITPPATFTTEFGAFMDSLDTFGSIQGGVLIGVVQVTGAPYVSTGRAYFAASAAIPTLTVDPNCLVGDHIPGGAPADSAFVLVPFHYGAVKVAQAAAGIPTTLDCSDPHVISVPEAINMITTVALYNQTIAAAAAARGWAYLDPNPLLRTLALDPTRIRPFPAFPPSPDAVAAPFGTALSRDGIHPSTSTQKLIAQVLRDSINVHYAAAIPAIP